MTTHTVGLNANLSWLLRQWANPGMITGPEKSLLIRDLHLVADEVERMRAELDSAYAVYGNPIGSHDRRQTRRCCCCRCCREA